MKINRNYQEPKAPTLGDIKHVHPFIFPDGDSLGCDPARIYIKIYPCSGITVDADDCGRKPNSVGGENSKYALVVDLEQGGIKAVEKCHPITELEAALDVKGPVEDRLWGGRR